MPELKGVKRKTWTLTVSDHDGIVFTLMCSLDTSQAGNSHKTTSSVESRHPRRTLQLPARHTFAPPMVTNATNPTHCAPLSEASLRRNLKHSQHRPS